MASITSLGVHQPVGLRHAIQEGILTRDPPASSYTWETIVSSEDGRDYEDELLTTENCVVWSRGGIFRKSFRFDLEKEPVIQALLAYFPASADTSPSAEHPTDPRSKSTKKPALSRALVVFFKAQAHIHFLSGTSHVVHMPFEVESACAGPRGVVIQRKLRFDGTSVSLRMPKVPPASFVSSQPPPAPRRSHGHSLTEFSTEGLGNPKVLPLRLSFTLENMWQQPMEPGESHWPRLVCLTDPLLEIGLVVTKPELPKSGKARKGSSAPCFLNRSEEILHIQTVKVRCLAAAGSAEVTIAVTVNRETNMYTMWRLTYPENEDPFHGPDKKRKPKPSRRRSSMAPGGATTPVHASARDSFGAPLPVKKTRKAIKVEDNNKMLEKTLSSLVDPEKGNDATRRQSRRVSSLLARADLSASQDRATFGEPSIHGGHGGRRADSHGSQRLRLSSGVGAPSFGATFNYNRINHLPEVPVDNLLEELRAGGDFEGFHHMGLDDHDFDGLVHEIRLTKIQSISMDNANVRYSLSGKPARTQAKVFILVGPPTATDDEGRSLLLVAIQDPVDKRLQLLTLHLEHMGDRTPTKNKNKHSKSPGTGDFIITPGEPMRVQSVVDSCKISDGHESIMILSEDKSGGRELSLQSPWGKVTTVTLPLLLMNNVSTLEFSGSHRTAGTICEHLPLRFAMGGTHIDAISHPDVRGAVDLRDKEGRHHRIRLQLQPSSLQVGRVLDVCRSVLHASYADRIMAGWWHVMQWLRDTKSRGLAHPIADMEWSAAVILLLSSFLALGHSSEASLRSLSSETLRPAAESKWAAMQLREAPNSASCPSWTRSKAWQWLLDGGVFDPRKPEVEEPGPCIDFIPVHVTLAKRWMASPAGLSAFGFDGYLPTALNRPSESRNAAAWSILLALHLMAEEQKLNVLFPEDSSPGPSDLKAVLHQLSGWVGWTKYEALYGLGMQSSSANEFAPLALAGLAEPPSSYCVLVWIQGHLATGHGAEYPTLSDLYAIATGDTAGGALRKPLWESLTPRTIMFERLFARLGSATHRFEAVVAMHECGFTPQVLETLPEAILAALQDVISICQPNPPGSWLEDLLAFVGRADMSGVLKPTNTSRPHGSGASAPSHDAKWDVRMLCQHLDGLNDHIEDAGAAERQAVVRSLFREDRRLSEAQGLLSTVKHRIVRLDPRPEWNEAEYLEKQKELATTIATSTLAIPAGRGLLHFALRYPLLTQKYQIPGFNLTCIVKPANNTVSVDKSLFPEEKINWAFFHQGVAGGLAISPHAKGIDTSWILYNKPGQDLSNRHAGFLLALGLNGHLRSVAKWVAFKYLTPKHTMTTIGLLLGLAASYIGTMDALMTRLLSVHVTRMLPRGAADLNLSTATQTTGVMGVGLVYCNSQHRRMSEIMLSEIDHVGIEEEEEGSVRDESYRLAAGFALGFINLGKGGDLRGLRDMQLTEKLLTMATATKRVEMVHVLDWSAAGAVVAIALIYMKSEDQIVARKIDVPDTLLQFDYVRPDILLLRTVAKNLILWSEVDPTFEWIRDGLPSEYRQRYKLTDVFRLESRDLPFFSILAGLCFALGLRFAGSANVRVRDLLVHYLDQFIRIVRLPVSHYDSELARNNACMCMDLLALSCATVMAGTGDIVVLRRLRALHGRDDATTTYGSHLAAHLAIGALFLGSGTATFGTSNLAVASLLVAFYPLFPANVQDNRSHLQAFRHFWVLATEPRCLVTKDLVTGQPLTVPILIHLQPNSPSAVAAAAASDDNNNNNNNSDHPITNRDGETITITLRRQTPCLLPPLDDIARVETDAKSLGYWDLAIPFARAPHLRDDFVRNQTIYLRRRPADEGPFPATLRALAGGGSGSGSGSNMVLSGRGTESAVAAVTTSVATVLYGVVREPFEWVFGLPSLADLSRAERDAVLDRFGTGGGGGVEGGGTAVDARLVLRAGVDDEAGGCWSRERLLGLRLLFEWAERRVLFLQGGSGGGGGVEAEKQGGESGKGRWAKEKGKKTASGRSKKKVSLGVAQHDIRGDEQEVESRDAGAVEASWWLKDSAIEELKGRTWLAGRQG
ncbi:hypothetical protein N658DRAFT_486268 [Parathielavia hyrcaniae]|uniref:Anaphase-promoting complex subunit 1 N-terminal domain-containing protein n=1 Tax=Parathielavia hyrcaniae TaxID=113614 RepID=A0AAN6Q0A6_9PEZI|nr:hypothetical protein N658DRAFT_486268 [Parathielavia hyrcaniae]